MKKILLALVLVSLLAIVSPATALAYSPPGADVEVTLTPITVVTVGEEVTVSGSITITSTATTFGSWAEVYTESYAWYSVDYEGEIVGSGDQYCEDYDSSWWFPEYLSVDASQVYDWSYILPDNAGVYIITQGGNGYAEVDNWWWDDEDYDEDSSGVMVEKSESGGASFVSLPPHEHWGSRSTVIHQHATGTYYAP